MDLVEVDVIEPQPFQTGPDLVHDMAAGHAGAVRPRPHPAEHLGGDHHLLAGHAQIAQRLAEDPLRQPLAVQPRVPPHVRRMFGAPPGRDGLHLRATLSADRVTVVT